MSKYLKQLYFVLIGLLKTRYKWILILFSLWLYRVDFIADVGSGRAKMLQVITIFGMLYLIIKYQSNIITYTFSKTHTPIKTFLWLYVYAIISTFWAYSPTFSFFLSFQNTVFMIVLVWLFTKMNNFISMEKTFIYLMIISMLFEVVMIRIIESPVLFIHFLPGGSSAAICISYCIGELISMKKKDATRRHFLYNSLIIASVVLITSTSSGANVSAIIGIGIALFISGKVRYALPLIIGSVVLYLNQQWIDEIILFIMPGKTKEIIEIGNGRDTIWAGIMAVTAQRPLYGWGYACGERVASGYLNWALSDAHNNYIGLYGGLGLIGIILFVWHQFVSIINIFTRRNRIGFTGLFSAFCCASINGYSYGYLSGKACSITIIYMAMLALSLTYTFTRYYDKQRIK